MNEPAIDRDLESTLERALGDAAAELRPLRSRVLARLDAMPRPREARNRHQPIPFLGRRRNIFLLIHAVAAALLLTAYAGYLSLMKIQRQALAAEARVEVKNLAIVLRALGERGSQPSLGAALARLKLERDPFGNPYAYEAPALVYSFGANGRDERGSGDDIIAFLR